MELKEYDAAQQSIVAAVAALILRVLFPFRSVQLTQRDWPSILAAIYPSVERARLQSAELAREFYDSERAKHVPGAERHDLFLASYKPSWFEEAMRPARDEMIRPGAGDSGRVKTALIVAKEVENGGRRTTLRAVENDPVVKGWARVATGRETCAFCLMMVSRGPVYLSAESAGLDLDDTSAVDLWQRGDDAALDELMTRWHAGCDCKAVPVFKRESWPGRDGYLEAKRIWAETTKGYSGRDALNALRRAIESGDIDPQDIAAAA